MPPCPFGDVLSNMDPPDLDALRYALYSMAAHVCKTGNRQTPLFVYAYVMLHQTDQRGERRIFGNPAFAASMKGSGARHAEEHALRDFAKEIHAKSYTVSNMASLSLTMLIFHAGGNSGNGGSHKVSVCANCCHAIAQFVHDEGLDAPRTIVCSPTRLAKRSPVQRWVAPYAALKGVQEEGPGALVDVYFVNAKLNDNSLDSIPECFEMGMDVGSIVQHHVQVLKGSTACQHYSDYRPVPHIFEHNITETISEQRTTSNSLVSGRTIAEPTTNQPPAQTFVSRLAPPWLRKQLGFSQ